MKKEFFEGFDKDVKKENYKKILWSFVSVIIVIVLGYSGFRIYGNYKNNDSGSFSGSDNISNSSVRGISKSDNNDLRIQELEKKIEEQNKQIGEITKILGLTTDVQVESMNSIDKIIFLETEIRVLKQGQDISKKQINLYNQRMDSLESKIKDIERDIQKIKNELRVYY